MSLPKFTKISGASDYGDQFKDVRITITGTYPSIFADSDWGFTKEEGIANQLNTRGWLVEQVSDVSVSWIPNINNYIFEIYAVVGRSYTDNDIKVSIQRDLAGFFNVNGITVHSGIGLPNVSQDDQRGILDTILNKLNTAAKGSGVTPTIFGFSIGTAVLLGLGAVVILKRK